MLSHNDSHSRMRRSTKIETYFKCKAWNSTKQTRNCSSNPSPLWHLLCTIELLPGRGDALQFLLRTSYPPSCTSPQLRPKKVLCISEHQGLTNDHKICIDYARLTHQLHSTLHKFLSKDGDKITMQSKCSFNTPQTLEYLRET